MAGIKSAFQSWVWSYLLERSSPFTMPTLFSWPGDRTQGEPGSIGLVGFGLASSTDFLCDLEQNRDLIILARIPNMQKEYKVMGNKGENVVGSTYKFPHHLSRLQFPYL